MKRSGHAASLFIIVIAIVAITTLLAIAVLGFFVRGTNRVKGLDEVTVEAWSNVDTQLQRRLDLIPNLVSTVQGYAQQEKELFENIAKSREKYFQASNVPQKIAASSELGGFLSRLLVLQERYPELKSNQNFLALQDQLEGTENRIAVARTRYNQSVKELNSYCRKFPGSLFADRANVEEREYFEATSEARTTVPKVDFSSSGTGGGRTTAPQPTARQDQAKPADQTEPQPVPVHPTTPKPRQATGVAR